jgi:hypothetical protein
MKKSDSGSKQWNEPENLLNSFKSHYQGGEVFLLMAEKPKNISQLASTDYLQSICVLL